MVFTISKGFEDAERPRIAALYWEAFARKLTFVMGPPSLGQYFITTHLSPDFALIARAQDGSVQGVAGFKTAEGALIGGEMSDLAQVYGWLSTLWRAPLLTLVERKLEEDVLLMDGICVASEARRSGVGTALLEAIRNEACAQGKRTVRLDVIDTNPRAKALYQRQGFKAIETNDIGPLRWIFGFQSSTTMHQIVG